jgi:membrane-associated protein
MIEFFKLLYQLLRHLNEDAAWNNLINYVGAPWVYATIFAIIFFETGVVILPFLPGDSLLFALGAIAARPDIGLGFWPMFTLALVAAIVGDAVNYSIGKAMGPAIFNRPETVGGPRRLRDRLLNRKHLKQAQDFYEKHGGKTIILARFVPIIRTFAPFVAGIGKMSYPRFAAYNVIGAVSWVSICMAAGWWFGNREWVKKNFELVIIAIIVISVLPVVIEFVKARRAARRGASPVVEATTLGESPE